MFVIFVYVLSVENGTHGVIRFSNLLTAWDASHAAFQAARIESSGNQSASRTHPLRSDPGDLWIQLAHRAKQQDREQHDEQTEQETGYVHKATLLGEFCIDPASRPVRVLITAEWVNFGQDRCKLAGGDCLLAEKPKMGKLQMDWLRSEDLNEEKNGIASTASIAG
jgi:hypothetical protein